MEVWRGQLGSTLKQEWEGKALQLSNLCRNRINSGWTLTVKKGLATASHISILRKCGEFVCAPSTNLMNRPSRSTCSSLSSRLCIGLKVWLKPAIGCRCLKFGTGRKFATVFLQRHLSDDVVIDTTGVELEAFGAAYGYACSLVQQVRHRFPDPDNFTDCTGASCGSPSNGPPPATKTRFANALNSRPPNDAHSFSPHRGSFRGGPARFQYGRSTKNHKSLIDFQSRWCPEIAEAHSYYLLGTAAKPPFHYYDGFDWPKKTIATPTNQHNDRSFRLYCASFCEARRCICRSCSPQGKQTLPDETT
jgi:hypothetical protein